MEIVAHSEVEEAHPSMVEEVTNIRTPIPTDMDKILATIDRVMAINSTRHHSNIKLHLDPISTLHLMSCKLRPIHNLECLNTGSQTYIPLDRLASHFTETSIMATHHLEENVHESRLSGTQTEDIP